MLFQLTLFTFYVKQLLAILWAQVTGLKTTISKQCTVGQIRGFCPMGILSNMELSVEVCAGLLQSVPMGAAECVHGYRVIKYFLKFLKNIFWRKKIF